MQKLKQNSITLPQVQSSPINQNKSPQELLSGMLDAMIPTGMFGPMANKEMLMQRFTNLRTQMIENFGSANDPKIVAQNYMQKYMSFMYSGEEQLELQQVQAKQFTIPKLQIKPIELLQYSKITPQELTIEKVHYNYYLELDIKINCFRGQAYHFLAGEIEDPSDQNYEDINQSDQDERLKSVLACSVYKMENIYDIRYFQAGRKFVVLDPYFRFGNDCMAFVKVEDRDKLILLENNQTIDDIIEDALKTQTALDLKNSGNKEFGAGKFQGAINLYTYGITKAKSAKDQQLLGVLFGNRSQSFFNVRQYEKCLKDCEEALKLDPDNKKFKFRRAKVLGFLNREEEALQQLQLLDPTQQDKDIQEGIVQVQERLNQSKGMYNLSKLIEQSKKLKSITDIEVKEFIGPIEIGLIEGKNRGIIAQADIKKGQIILVEKAFSSNEQRQELRFELEQTFVYLNHHENIPLLRNTQCQMLNDSQSAKWVKYLFNGTNGELKVSIQELSKKHKLPKSQQRITYQEMDKMIKFNQCECMPLQSIFKKLKSLDKIVDKQAMGKLSALWPIFSFINHECNANTTRFSIGDALFIVALRNINQGEEITQLYMPLASAFEERENLMQKSWGFKCTCISCQRYISLPEDIKQLLKCAFIQPQNDKERKQMKNELLMSLPIVTSKLTELNLESTYLSDYYQMLVECLAIFGLQNDEKSFLKYWENFKQFGDLQEVSKLKQAALMSFGVQSQAYKAVSQLQKELFMIEFQNDQELFEKYG
eukprot:403366287